MMDHRYSYFATVPLLVVFSVAMAGLKYKEGTRFPFENMHGNRTTSSKVTSWNRMDPVRHIQDDHLLFAHPIIPVTSRPSQLWVESSRRWILPLYFVLSSAWALELSVDSLPPSYSFTKPSLSQGNTSRRYHNPSLIPSPRD